MGSSQLAYANVMWFDLGAIWRALEAEDMRDVSEGKTITGEEVRQVFEAMLPQGEIDHLYQRDCGSRLTFYRWFDELFDRFM